ncbi:MAG: hypothetical protein GYA14_01230, partial [Ignavibacteria bacterium]|nr:hypothetical protein [Ignavibacteria bacterium]
MKSLRCIHPKQIFFLLILLPILLTAQEKKKITIEWRYSPEAQSITQLPNFQWLDNGMAMVYDAKKPADKRTLEIFDPNTLTFKPALDMKKALESLKELLGDKTPAMLIPTNNYDKNGDKAIYTFSGDIFLLDLINRSFARITNTTEDEKN